MNSYLVGRDPKTVQILIPKQESTVSNQHLELTENAQGHFYFTDCNSTNGTYVQRQGRWLRLDKGYVSADEPLLLGRYQTSVRQLLALRIDTANAHLKNVRMENVEKKVLNGRLERDEYGRVVKK